MYHVSDLNFFFVFVLVFCRCANSGCASNTKLKLGGAMSCLPLPVFLVMQPSSSGRCKQYKAWGGHVTRTLPGLIPVIVAISCDKSSSWDGME